MYVGITGTTAAGKGEIVKILRQFGFKHYSFSEALRDMAVKQGLAASRYELTRVQVTKFANEQRVLHGPGFVADFLLHQCQEEAPKNAVFESIRSKAELATLKRLPGFVLISVDAPRPVRFERLMQRGKEGISTFEEFCAWDDSQLEGGENEQHILAVMDQADVSLVNVGELSELEEQLREALNI